MEIAIFKIIKPKHPNIAKTKLSAEKNNFFKLLIKAFKEIILL